LPPESLILKAFEKYSDGLDKKSSAIEQDSDLINKPKKPPLI